MIFLQQPPQRIRIRHPRYRLSVRQWRLDSTINNEEILPLLRWKRRCERQLRAYTSDVKSASLTKKCHVGVTTVFTHNLRQMRADARYQNLSANVQSGLNRQAWTLVLFTIRPHINDDWTFHDQDSTAPT